MRNICVLLMSALIMAGCSSNNSSHSGSEDDTLITINVKASYPKKELIVQDFMDVEYIVLDDADEFVTEGVVRAISKNLIIVTNGRINDGDIFLFDRNGKGLRKFNRKGNGSEEYTTIGGVLVDDDNEEIIVKKTRNAVVYDFYGKYKRSFNFREGAAYGDIYNFDRENWICYELNFSSEEEVEQPYSVISKQDGSVVRDILIPVEKKVSTDVPFSFGIGRGVGYGILGYFRIIPYLDGWILTESSSDTVYSLSSDFSMVPVITRTPSVQSMDPEVFLFPKMITDRYYFMQTVRKEFDFERKIAFPSNLLVYDRQEKATYECTLLNGDFIKNKIISLSDSNAQPVNSEIACCLKLESYQLVESYEKGELQGKLKEIAAGLNEESNPVIMLIKHKQ